MSDGVREGRESGEAPGIRHRLGEALASAAALLSTRWEIFVEEASGKAALLARGLAAFVLALAAAGMVLLLVAALLVALLTLLFGHLWAGILATLLLYAACAAAAALFGWNAFSKLRPLDFPVTRAELAKDWRVLASRIRREETPSSPGASTSASARPAGRSDWSMDDVESRFREGSE